MRRSAVLVLSVLSMLAALAVPATAGPGGAGASGVIPGRFIVTVADGVDARAVARDYGRRPGAEVDFVYEAALNGFAGTMSDGALAAARRDGRITRVEPDGVVTVADDALTVQQDPTWGLDRIDERQRILDRKYHYATAASDVRVYVLDTGIRASHNDFGGRVSTTHGFNAFNDGVHFATDCQGHGTHVAGTIGAATWGVAKQVSLSSVRVLNCSGSGTWSGVIAGINWVTDQHQATGGPSVANMSLGGGANSSVDAAVRNSVAAGVTYAVAAGNDSGDACTKSPARVAEALTVAATSSSDQRASWSNRGACVDLFAPGVSITSTDRASNTATSTKSGTSMASPHVAGVAALYLAVEPSHVGATVHDAVTDNATPGVVSSPGPRSPNLLLHSLWESAGDGGGGDGGGDEDPVDDPPAGDLDASFTYNCGNNETCTFTAAASGVSYAWSVDGGSVAGGHSLTYTFPTVGSYTVTLTVTDLTGATGTSQADITCTAKGKSGKFGCS